MTNLSPAVAFLKLLFDATEHPVYISSLPNIKDDPTEPTERHLTTRDPARVDAFKLKWDRPGRGLFICVATINGVKRNKDACVETGFLHADIDFKNVVEDEPTIRERLRTLRYPPSIIVRSGNGLHCYWLFKEALQTQEHRDRIEAVLRQLADLVAGDLQVCEVSRLMRLPGSHNSKGHTSDTPVWTEVVMDPVVGELRRYELSDLEEWLSETAPVLHRKVDLDEAKHWPRETNPYLEHAKLHGFKPPLDVEQALAEMAFGNIHQTQLSVTASLLNAGREIDEVVDILIEATQDAAGSHGMRWNWTRERRAIRRMCESWLVKHPQREQVKETSTVNPDGQSVEKSAPLPIDSENIVDLGAARTKRQPKAEKPPRPAPAAKASLHIALASTTLLVLLERGERVLFTDEGAFRYADGLWQLKTDAAMRAWLDFELQIAANELRMEPNNKLIGEARNWIIRDRQRAAPAWDAHGMVPTRSGLVDPRTGELKPAAPEHHCTWRIDVDYDPAARCPLWLQMLDDAFADRDPVTREIIIALLQDMLGAGLIDHKPRALSKALIFKGGSLTGKSTLLEVMGGLFSADTNGTPLDMIGGNNNAHALVPFARRVPWILHEAFDQRWHMSNVVKALITGEPVQINVKNGPLYTHRFTAPIYWGTNHPPQFKEATAAMVNRIVPLECLRTFDPDSPVGVALEAQRRGYAKPSDIVLATELPGVLAWAVAGLRRALVSGKLTMPPEARATSAAIRRDSNLALGFIEDCVAFDPGGMVSVPDFSIAHTIWWRENRGDDAKPPSSDSIGRAISALGDPRIVRLRGDLKRYYGGVKFNEQGMRFWRDAVTSQAFDTQGRKANTTNPEGDPNVSIPVAWSVRSDVVSLRLAHEASERVAMSEDVSASQPTDTVDEPPPF